MKFFQKFLMVCCLLCLLFVSALLINGIMFLRTIKYHSQLQEPAKTVEQNINDLSNTGICVGCDLGWKKDEYEQIRDLRDEVKTAKSKELKIDLSYSNLTGVNLAGGDLSGAKLVGANLNGTNFTDANLSGANLSKTWCAITKMSGANLAKADLRSAVFERANLSEADLTGADLRGALLFSLRLLDAKLSGVDLRGARIIANINHLNLTDVKMDGMCMRLFYKWSFQLVETFITLKDNISEKWSGK